MRVSSRATSGGTSVSRCAPPTSGVRTSGAGGALCPIDGALEPVFPVGDKRFDGCVPGARTWVLSTGRVGDAVGVADAGDSAYGSAVALVDGGIFSE